MEQGGAEPSAFSHSRMRAMGAGGARSKRRFDTPGWIPKLSASAAVLPSHRSKRARSAASSARAGEGVPRGAQVV